MSSGSSIYFFFCGFYENEDHNSLKQHQAETKEWFENHNLCTLLLVEKHLICDVAFPAVPLKKKIMV